MPTGGTGTVNGQDGTVHLQQVIAMLLPTDDESSIRKADAQFDTPNQFASLNPPLVLSDPRPTHSEGENSNRLLYLKKLIADVQSQMQDNAHPRRRVFSYRSKLEINGS